MNYNIPELIAQHQSVISAIEADKKLQKLIEKSILLISKTYSKGGKTLFCGNGGSAADSEHLAAELSGRFAMERPALSAEALHTSGAALTAISNDYSYKEVFARLLESKGKKGDVLIVMTTSGKSENIKKAIVKAKAMKLKVIAITGKTKSTVYKSADIHLVLPSSNTPRIQEAMLLIGHIICGGVEKTLFS